MNKVKVCYILMLCALFASCDIGGSESDRKSKPINYADNPAFKDAVIKNDVELEGSGVKLKEAYLMNKDQKRLTANEVKVGE